MLKTMLQRKDNEDTVFMCALRVYREGGWEGFYRSDVWPMAQSADSSGHLQGDGDEDLPDGYYLYVIPWLPLHQHCHSAVLHRC